MTKRRKTKIKLAFFISLSFLLVSIACWFLLLQDVDFIDKVIPIISMGATVLAAIWLTYGFFLQSEQLADQKLQFLETSRNMYLSSKRETMIFCKELMQDTINYLNKQGIGEFSNFIQDYVNFTEMAQMLNSESVDVVISNGEVWVKKESYATRFIRDYAFAVMLYLDTVNIEYDITIDPEVFLANHIENIPSIPFLYEYTGLGGFLASMMVKVKPQRSSAFLAFQVAHALKDKEGIWKKEKLKEEIDQLITKSYPIPRVCEQFLSEEFH